jgi:hypothetical protein
VLRIHLRFRAYRTTSRWRLSSMSSICLFHVTKHVRWWCYLKCYVNRYNWHVRSSEKSHVIMGRETSNIKENMWRAVAHEVHADQYIVISICSKCTSTRDTTIKLSTTTLPFNHPKFSTYKFPWKIDWKTGIYFMASMISWFNPHGLLQGYMRDNPYFTKYISV